MNASDRILAVRISDQAIISDITPHNILPSGCERYYCQQSPQNHESGASAWKIVDDQVIQRSADEIKLEPEYIAWKKNKREDKIVGLIRKKYTSNKEYQIIRKALAKLADGQPVDAEFMAYNSDVETIITNNPEE